VLCAGQLVERGPARDLIGAPQHPYTQALADARGSTDSVAPSSDGCPFSKGCSFSEHACVGTRMTLQSVTAHHATACVRWRSLRPLAA
jgi:peptide/nickel transport system ATP-binding protein